MNLTFYCYPKCGTCRSAKKWLDQHNLSYQEIHIAESPPSVKEIKEIYLKSGIDLKKFFNTSGIKYRELGLKDKLKTATEQEMFELLASDGMLIKRPLISDGNKVTIGFNEKDFAKVWL
ncbi:arsenate reductase family protein [Bacillus sp. CGMCC 1.16607]|uniref:arsenate reductase family protein n=1 Tax=Bacillus sp. CGMCC 1.16607 TaxID=3351842 RepID=UPI00362EB2DF